MGSPPPTTLFETTRLRFNVIDERYLRPLCELLSNERVHRYYPKALDRDEAIVFFDRILYRYKKDGYCYWAVIRKQDAAFLGICGIINQRIEGKNEAEVGYRLIDTFWNHGYGTEAAGGCVAYAQSVLKRSSVISLIRKVNIPSVRVAEKNTFQFEKTVLFQGVPHQLYRRWLHR